MAKFLILWELDDSRAPLDAEERGTMWGAMVDMIKEDMASGGTTDWGCFVGETKGYTVAESDEVELAVGLQRFYPFVTFKVFPVMSIDQMTEVAHSLTE